MRHGEVVGEGYHRRVGGPHAEVEALARAGDEARDSTLYVTLEPCSHRGRTPPCSDAVIAAGVRRVVACHRDPDRRVAGRGFERLRAAGIAVEIGERAAAAVRLNLAFVTSCLLARPAVTLKWAMSLDGKIATVSGDSQWISSPPSRRWSLDLRESHDAILVGSETALADDPRLTRRLGKADGPILRIVLDRRLRLPADRRMLSEAGEVLIYTAAEAPEERRESLRRAGARVVVLARPEVPEVLRDLHRRGVRSLLVEGGGEVAAAFLEAGLYDRVAVAVAPLLIGGRSAPGPLAGAGMDPLSSAPRLEDLTIRQRGPDRIIEGYRAECLPALLSSVES